MFVDNVEIKIYAGKGGRGLASFRREKFLPFGGPDGGDGGKGGDVYFVADSNMEDLGTFKHKLVYKAQNGGTGGPNQRHGLNAADLIIKVPVGTSIYIRDGENELLTADLKQDKQKALLARGGKGGKGNVHFATATRKAPRMSQPGEAGQQYDVIMKVSLPMDVAILGFANTGKSSVIEAISAAKPTIADYPYTTREPVLAIVDDGAKKYSWAEIPAVMEGGSKGKGAGNRYLGQADRAKVIVYLLDAGSADVFDELGRLKTSVASFSASLADKKSVIAVNKIDLVEPADQNALKEKLEAFGSPVLFIAAAEELGLSELVTRVHQLVSEEKEKIADQIQPEVIFRPKPVDKRG
jgi:GTPase